MPPHSTELSIAARFAEMPGLLARMSAQAESLGVLPDAVRRMQLIIEEFVSNCITHGYGGECEQSLRIEMQIDRDSIRLVFSDQAQAFDLSRMSVTDPEPKQVGGLGINLMLGLARKISYQRVAGSNITEIDL